MTEIKDHPLRYALANELHARPFPMLTAPCHAVFLAVKQIAGAGRSPNLRACRGRWWLAF